MLGAPKTETEVRVCSGLLHCEVVSEVLTLHKVHTTMGCMGLAGIP